MKDKNHDKYVWHRMPTEYTTCYEDAEYDITEDMIGICLGLRVGIKCQCHPYRYMDSTGQILWRKKFLLPSELHHEDADMPVCILPNFTEYALKHYYWRDDNGDWWYTEWELAKPLEFKVGQLWKRADGKIIKVKRIEDDITFCDRERDDIVWGYDFYGKLLGHQHDSNSEFHLVELYKECEDPEIGQFGAFWDYEICASIYGELNGLVENEGSAFRCAPHRWYKNFKPMSPEEFVKFRKGEL